MPSLQQQYLYISWHHRGGLPANDKLFNLLSLLPAVPQGIFAVRSPGCPLELHYSACRLAITSLGSKHRHSTVFSAKSEFPGLPQDHSPHRVIVSSRFLTGHSTLSSFPMLLSPGDLAWGYGLVNWDQTAYYSSSMFRGVHHVMRSELISDILAATWGLSPV